MLAVSGRSSFLASLYPLFTSLFVMLSKLCCCQKQALPLDQAERECFLNALTTTCHPCIFCGVSKESGFNVNEKYVVFTDINPSSQHHLQVAPRRHIESIKSLDKSHVQMIKDMIEIGHEVLDNLDVPPNLRRLGFHIPPYISVGHLHMHVQALPYRSILRRLKYPVVRGRSGRDKGLSWFVEAEQAVRILEKGARVRILPC
ncbi:HIT-like protein [Trametes coccinea BRFM310]|uniref:HIT-like protein n=1 Tax=Trametes coccinea (strain BRFM310) TaxID=1353009 RepID=A0A1Y2J235_TRAC3|nr:HIT-like protein [Trametes coccinea BRFM310]